MATPGQSVVTFASTFIGMVPYALGAPTAKSAAGLTKADCSSFVQFLYQQAGIALPRTADQQYKATQTLQVANPSTATLQPGDLLFFGGWGTPENMPGYAGIQHVAIYAGNGNIIQEGGTTAGNVNVTPLSAYEGHFIAATRPFADSSTTGLASQVAAGITAGTTSDKLTSAADVFPFLSKYQGQTWGKLISDNPQPFAGIPIDWATLLDQKNPNSMITASDMTSLSEAVFAIITVKEAGLSQTPDIKLLDPLAQIAALLGKFTNPSNWLHLGAMLAGVALVGFGMWTVTKDLNETGPQGLVSPIPVMLKHGA